MIPFAVEDEHSLTTLQDRFVWETPSFEKTERPPSWYMILGVLSLFLLAYAIWTENFLFAFFILLADITLIIGHNQTPHTVLVQVGEHGVVWDGKLYLYPDLEHFAIIYDPPYAKTLYLQQKTGLQPRIRIHLQDQDPIPLREHLRQYLRENLDLRNEYSSDIFARLLRL